MASNRYPRFIERYTIEAVTDRENDRRFSLTVRIKKRGNAVLLVILNHMGAADEEYCDKRIYRILKYCYGSEDLKEVGEVIVMGLFPICLCKGEDILNKLYERGAEFIAGNDGFDCPEQKRITNRELLASNIEKADKIILAWGNPLKGLGKYYREGIGFVKKQLINKDKELLSVFTVGQKSHKGYPKSCLSWSYRDHLKNITHIKE